MPIKFDPKYAITDKIAGFLIRIEAAKEQLQHLPLTPTVLASLRETARLYTTHYSTQIEGNQLDPDQVEKVLKHKGHFPGRERDEQEVKGYYSALRQVEDWAAADVAISEKRIQTLHALVMANGKSRVNPTSYRDGQNVIQDSRTREIVYLPPEANDVPDLMRALTKWITTKKETPSPLIAGIAHYQFATIHPYYDGNGRTARLLTTLILHLGGYGLKGIYSLEEYYALQLNDYYQALSVGPSHNYYMGRDKADITGWLEYFTEGMAIAFENVYLSMRCAKKDGYQDQSNLIRSLDPKQRKVLELFSSFETITARQISELFCFKPRTGSKLCKDWVESGFLIVVDFSRKARRYRLSSKYEILLSSL